MSNYVKIKRPFKVYDAKAVTYKGVTYLECLVANGNGTSIVAVATKTATEQLTNFLIETDKMKAVVESVKNGKAVDIHEYGLIAWLTVNECGHTISYVRKE